MMTTQKIDITSSTVFRIILVLIVFWFLYIIRDILLMLLAAFVVASAVEPVANWLQRYKVPRALTVIFVYLIILAVLSSVVTLMIPPLTEQVVQLAQTLPQVVDKLQQWGGVVLPGSQEAIVSPLQDVLLRFGDNLANVGLNIFQQTRTLFSGIFSLLFVFILAFYLVVEKDALKKLFRLVVPRDHVAYAEHVVDRVQRNIGLWVLAQLALAVVIGLVVGVGLWLLGVKYALVLGLLAGVMEIVPVIGPIVAAIPAVLVALSQSLFLGLATLVFFVLVQQAENNVLVPNIMRKATGLHPLVVLIAVLLGARLAGLTGVILSVPVATIVNILMSDFFKSAAADEELAG